jgi:hypothetical protein
MIVVCGSLEPVGRHEGAAFAIAGRAAAAGAPVQVIGIVPDGPAGDRRLLALAAAGIGHAAVLRTASRTLEAADVDLALRYLPELRVVIAAGTDPNVLPTLVDGAAYAGASLVVIGRAGEIDGERDLPSSAIVLEAPANDPDGTFAGFVGSFAARLDGGTVSADAWDATVRELAVDPVRPGPGRRGPASAR